MPPRKTPANRTGAKPTPAAAKTPEAPAPSDPVALKPGTGEHDELRYRNKRTGREFAVVGLDADLMPPAFVDAFYRDRERGEMRLIFRRVD